jgi:hypothetical protein
MADFLGEVLGHALRASPAIVKAGLGFLACVVMGVSGWLYGGDNRLTVAGVFAAGALLCLLFAIVRWRSRSRWE